MRYNFSSINKGVTHLSTLIFKSLQKNLQQKLHNLSVKYNTINVSNRIGKGLMILLSGSFRKNY